MIYPRGFGENIQFRAETLNKCEQDVTTATMVRELAKRDILFFFNVFMWAEDPNAVKGLRHGVPSYRIRPIITYPFQDKMILDIQEAIMRGEDDITDKSRDMLATYMVLGVFLHGWLFSAHKYMISSWKQDEIDGKEDTSTHFGKLRLNLKRLPFFLMPTGFDWKKHSTYMSLQNPENGGTLTGSAASASLASGRREDAIFFDELSKWEDHAKSAWTSASDATKCKIGVWTPRGSANHAAELMHGAEVKRKNHLFWYFHPEKCYTSAGHIAKVKRGEVYDKVNKRVVVVLADQLKAPEGCYLDQFGKVRSEWYDLDCEKRSKEDILENIDCNYLTTGNPVFDTEICNLRKMQCKVPLAIGNLMWRIRPIFDERTGYCKNKAQLDVEFVGNINGIYKVWEYPLLGWENGYSVSADVAEGLAQGDYDSASGIRRFPLPNQSLQDFRPTVTISLHAHLKTFEYAEELAKMAVYLNRAWLAIERTGLGLSVVDQVFKFYDKLFHKEVMTKGYPVQTDKIGWDTNGQTKPHIITNLSKMISSGGLVDNDEGFWTETLTFVNNDGRQEAQGKSQGQRCYDDRVMDRAINFWVHNELPFPVRQEKKEKLTGWRKQKWEGQEKKQLVGWTV